MPKTQSALMAELCALLVNSAAAGSIAPSTVLANLLDVVASLAPLVATPSNYTSILEAAGPGSTIFFTGGTYRLTSSIVPQAGQQFISDGTAILNGSVLVSSFTDNSGVYSASLPGVSYYNSGGDGDGAVCQSGYRCYLGNDVYVNDVLYQGVVAQADVIAGTNTAFIDYTQNPPVLYIGQNPAGQTVEVCNTTYCFDGSSTGAAGSGISISGFVVEKFASLASDGAIGGGPYAVANWRVTNCEMRYNHGAGICLGNDWIVDGCYMHNNGMEGYSAPSANGSTIRNCEIAYNNTAGFSTGWGGGAGKHSACTNAAVIDCYVHDNYGNGIWYDGNNIKSVIRGNVIEQNAGAGIVYEISYDGVISDNVLRSNTTGYPEYSPYDDYAAIQILNSQNLDIARNSIITGYQGGGGISVVQIDRGTGTNGPWIAANLNIHDNDIVNQATTAYSIALSSNYEETTFLSATNGIVISGNRHHVPVDTTYYSGLSINTAGNTWAQWQSAGYDANGSIDNNLFPAANYVYTPENLGATSGTFAQWFLSSGCTATANAGADPNGVIDAAEISLIAGASGNSVLQQYVGGRPGAFSIGCWLNGTANDQVYLQMQDASGNWNQTLVTFTGAWQQATLLDFTISQGEGAGGRHSITISTNDRISSDNLAAATFLAWGYQANEGATLNASY